ncbi:MAG TPA: low molecular weight phosphatase family protein [Actinomycetota bacterium]|nr:low molecular weight phosphatase family protein [Actinomycetota bacterium]
MLSVLFVCTGNICRSPIAEGLLAHRSARLLGGTLRVGSAGTWARPGQPPMPETVRAAGERGVDISSLRASSLDPEIVGEADVVLTMTAEHRDEVARIAPEASSKTFTLKELVTLLRRLPPAPYPPSRDAALARIVAADELRRSADAPAVPDEDVADPLGMSVETYRAVAWELDGLVDALVGGLFGDLRRASAAAGGTGA